MGRTLAVMVTTGTLILALGAAAHAAEIAPTTTSIVAQETETADDDSDRTGLWGLLGRIGLAGLIKRRENANTERR